MKILVTYTIGKEKMEDCIPFADEDSISVQEAIEQACEQLQQYYPMAQNIHGQELLKNKGKPYLVDQLIELIHQERPDLTVNDLRQHEKLILRTDRESYEEGAFALTLPEAKQYMANSSNKFRDFVYLRRYGLVLFNIGHHTSHQIFTSAWHWIETVLFNNPGTTMDNYYSVRGDYRLHQESFLHDSLGFFMSRAMNLRQVEKSTNMRLTAAEKMVFGHIDFDELSPLTKERD